MIFNSNIKFSEGSWFQQTRHDLVEQNWGSPTWRAAKGSGKTSDVMEQLTIEGFFRVYKISNNEEREMTNPQQAELVASACTAGGSSIA